jgi:hypothetical protein
MGCPGMEGEPVGGKRVERRALQVAREWIV